MTEPVTFWHAARDIVAECYAVLRPGGVAVFVTKDFVRDRKRVPFSADWVRLCESCGFVLVKWARASLVTETVHNTLFDGEVVQRRERKSFFRRLAEKKGSPRIDEEDVLFLVKPGGAGDVDAVVGSPPFEGCDTKPTAMGIGKGTRADGDSAGRNKGDYHYGDTPGQLGTLPGGNVDAVVGSPPFAGNQGHPSLGHPEMNTGVGAGILRQATTGDKRGQEKYGHAYGQLGDMPIGTVDAVVSSPPYAEIATGAGGLNTKPAKPGQQGGRSASSASQDTDQRYGESEGQLSRLAVGSVDAVVSSPPYATGETRGHPSLGSVNKDDWGKDGRSITGRRELSGSYGNSDGQLADLPEGGVDAVISSPPYVNRVVHDHNGIDASKFAPGNHGGKNSQANAQGYGDADGQLATLSPGTVDAVVSSPPYISGGHHADQTGAWGELATEKRCGTKEHAGYGRTDGQMGQMKAGEVDAVIGSPPWGDNSEGAMRASKFRNPTDALAAGRGNGCSDEARLAQLHRDEQKTYGNSPGQLASMPAPAPAPDARPPYAEVTWHGCYDSNWNGLIVPEAFAHPAKMARGLVRRIFDDLFLTGYLKKGGTVVDPFGGIGTTALEGASRGVRVTICELEPKFYALAQENFALHRNGWQLTGLPEPRVVNGDSRKLRDHLAGVR